MNQYLAFAPGKSWTVACPVVIARATRGTDADVGGVAVLPLPIRGACFVSRHGRHDLLLTPPDDTTMLAVAPAAAVVVREAAYGPTGLGTHIVLRLADGSHLTLARVPAGGLLARLGQVVAPGDPIARFGPAPMLTRRHAGADPGSRATPFQCAARAEHGNGGPRWVAAGVPGRPAALLQPLWPTPDGPALRSAPHDSADAWLIDPVGPAALRFAHGRDPVGLLADCLALSVAIPPPAWLVGLWWRHDVAAGGAWRRGMARLWPALRVRSFVTMVSGDAEIGQLRVRLDGSGGSLPRLMRMEFGPDGLRWLHAEFADGWLAASLIDHSPGHGSTASPGQTACQRAAFAR